MRRTLSQKIKFQNAGNKSVENRLEKFYLENGAASLQNYLTVWLSLKSKNKQTILT